MLYAIGVICIGLVAIWLSPKMKAFGEKQTQQYEEKKRKKAEEKNAK